MFVAILHAAFMQVFPFLIDLRGITRRKIRKEPFTDKKRTVYIH